MEPVHPGGNETVQSRSWVSLSPLGPCRVQQTQRRSAAPPTSRCPRLGSLCRVRVCCPDDDQFCSETETDTCGPLAAAALPRRPESMLQVPLGAWTCLRLGDGHCDVTESCLEEMRAGDICEVLLSPLQSAWLSLDSERLQKNQSLRAEVELQTFTPGTETWELSAGEKLQWVKSHKQRGSERFRSGDVWGAADSYRRALRLLVTLQDGIRAPQRPLSVEEFCTIKSELHSNLSLCQLKVGQSERARASALRATVLEPDATKAWYRLGRACQLLDEPEEARRAFQQVLRLQPDSPVAVKALKDIAGREKRADQELGLRLSKMFT